ncbi:MAG: extracellular solute-binding protein, partial [Vallitaleaceae bacterium]|nr:extracellular solute-binding protein [Vallitaleaceae bacterium]
ILLVAAMLTTLFVGCTKDEVTDATDTPVADAGTDTPDADTDAPEVEAAEVTGTITVITQRTDLLLEDAPISMMDYAAAFNEIYPGVTVEFEGITDYEGQIRIRMNTVEYGDVLMIPRENFTLDMLPDFFEPLGTLEEMSAEYLWMTDFAYDGMSYGIPSVGNAQGVLYNKDVWAEAGITELPTSVDEYLADLQLVKDNTDSIPYYTNYAAGWPLGGQWEAEAPSLSGDPDWANSVAHQDAPWAEGEPYYVMSKLLYDIVANGLSEEDPTGTDWEGCKGMLARGDISSMVLGSWSIVQMQEAAVLEGLDPEVIGYMPFPYTAADGNIYAASGSDYNLGINVNSENKEAAKAWVMWFVNDSGFTIDQGGISPRIGAAMPSTLQGFEDLGVIFMTNNPAPAGEETLLDDVDAESEIGRWSESYRMRILEAAIGNRDETFDDIMADLNARWAAAREAVGAN